MLKKCDKEMNLSEKLSSLIQTKPSIIESDDDDFMTVEKLVSKENDSECSADELHISKFRKLNSGFLDEDDEKYLGKGISRSDLDSFIDSNSNGTEEDSCDEAQNSSDEDISDHETEEDEEALSETKVHLSKSGRNNKVKSNNRRPQNDNFKKDIFLKVASDAEKGKAIKNQLHIWDFLLECRMKFQKCLVASNQFPNYKNFPKFKNSNENSEFENSVSQCEKSLKRLLNSLLSFENALLELNEEFLSLSKQGGKAVNTNEDEEIFSDSEKDESNTENIISTKAKKLKKLNDFAVEIKKKHADFLTYRNSIIQKWNDKTRIGYISNKNFSAFEQSTLKQIEHVLTDKQRLIKRTQTKRSEYHILGEEDQEPPLKKIATEPNKDLSAISLDNKSKDICKEIFDDDDFYHQLLGEIVKRKANDVTDPVQLGRQWMQLQKIRSKMKKTVDTKASKGRKVRFVVHPKLVNFMMPINNFNYNEGVKVELFNSLFGKTRK